MRGVCERWAEDRVLQHSPIAFTLLEFVCVLAAIHQELLGHAASQDASASKPTLCVCLYQAKWQLTKRNSGSCVAPSKVKCGDQKHAHTAVCVSSLKTCVAIAALVHWQTRGETLLSTVAGESKRWESM